MPAFYLRGFAADDRVGTIQLPGDRRFVQSVKDASVAKDFYSIDEHPDGADVVEKALSEIEGLAAAVLKKIAAGTWPLQREDRMTLGYFVSLQAVRVPVLRQSMDRAAAMMMRLQIGAGGKASLRRQLEETHGSATDEQLEAVWAILTAPDGPPIKRSVAEHVGHMLELSEELVKYVVGRPWVLVRFNRRSLVTADDPVGLVADPRDEPYMGAGFMTAQGITFPLTRKLGLLMGNLEPLIEANIPVELVHDGGVDVVESGTTLFEKFFNQHTVGAASRWIYHHPDDERFVPDDLPDARPYSMEMSGADVDFTGEAWFGVPGDGARETE